ncbi:erythritol/L-threitol dehydrogenase-like [Halichondria panicea]|uniref:erythritol/L-threitol dehydrogenase-like n=1 Tax=Halichondria panicea TaxID=6063 RepID=UPI00312BA3BE
MSSAMAPSEAGTMECVMCHAPGDYRVEEVGVPEVGEGELLVKVLAVGICAGDAKCFAGAPYFWGDEVHPRYVEPPVIPGHEFIGEVVKLGPGAPEQYNVEVGDHAIAENIVPCWECRYCRRGSYNMCVPHNVFGFKQASQGAMATFMKYPKGAIVHKVSMSIPPVHAAFIEPLACSVHAVNLGEIQRGDVVVVSGCGPLGLGMVAAAKLKSPKTLIALDLYDWKLEIAQKCGADVVLNPTKCDLYAEVGRLSEGYGCDAYIEATGHPQSVRQGLQMIAKHGRFVEYSVFGKETSADWTIISDAKELTIKGGHLGPYCYPVAISMIEKNQLPLEDIITHQLTFAELERGIELVNKSAESIKVVLLPS